MARAFLDLDFVLDFSRETHFRLGGEETAQLTLPYPDLRIHFYGREDAFERLSYLDVVQNRVLPEWVKGKIVLIGSSLATDKDFFATPFSIFRSPARAYKDAFGKVVEEDFGPKTVGVACHAQAIETILNGTFVQDVHETYVIYLTILLGLLGLVFYGQRPGPLWGLPILLICFGLVLGVSHILFVRRLSWVEISPALCVLLVQYISGLGSQGAFSKKRAEFVTNLFGKYVSHSVVNDILSGKLGVSLEGRSREITVVFSDLRGFTTLSENLSAEETSRLLNTYFDAIIPIVFEHQGSPDKLMGAAIMAFFGAPAELEDHAKKRPEWPWQ